MILIFNTILDTKTRNNFSNIIAKRITFGKKYKVITLEDMVLDLDKFSHLIITGSELSASQGSKWDDKIINLIKVFLKMNKPILGICYGHQMIARAICGDKAVRRSSFPEFGWKKISVTPNSLFSNITQFIFLESRYDEVCYLDDRFEIIASNEQLPIQAFQLKNKPVFGVQFHPEMFWIDGTEMLEDHFLQNPEVKNYYRNEMEDYELIPQNTNIFKNFLEIQLPKMNIKP